MNKGQQSLHPHTILPVTTTITPQTPPPHPSDPPSPSQSPTPHLQVVALAVLSHTLQVVVVVAQALPCRGDIAGLQRLRHGAGTGAHFLPSLSGVAF